MPTIRVPGDKSITHRSLMLAALSDGTCSFTGALAAGDTRSTASCLRALGVRVSPVTDGREVRVLGMGLGGLKRATRRLNCGNSGTTARLMMGVLAASRFEVTLTGDASLRRRPMERVASPLRTMGATIRLTNGTLPATMRGGKLTPIRYASPVSSAQVKTSLMFAALRGRVHLMVSEPVLSRDHTERMLEHLGVAVQRSTGAQGAVAEISPVEKLPAFSGEIPGDPSSAAYLIAAAMLGDRDDVRLESVGVNPTRSGFLRALERMGASVTMEDRHMSLGEPIATLIARPGPLRPVVVEPNEVPSMVDEIPLLACLASRAPGTSVFKGVGELRVKESDRLALVAGNLRSLGVDATTEGDTLTVQGTTKPPRGAIVTARDHRLAMSFAVLGAVPQAQVRVDDPDCVAISYPAFYRDLKTILTA